MKQLPLICFLFLISTQVTHGFVFETFIGIVLNFFMTVFEQIKRELFNDDCPGICIPVMAVDYCPAINRKGSCTSEFINTQCCVLFPKHNEIETTTPELLTSTTTTTTTTPSTTTEAVLNVNDMMYQDTDSKVNKQTETTSIRFNLSSIIPTTEASKVDEEAKVTENADTTKGVETGNTSNTNSDTTPPIPIAKSLRRRKKNQRNSMIGKQENFMPIMSEVTVE